MSEEFIRYVEYATLPVFDVAHGVALGAAVVAAVPKQAPPEAKSAAQQVRDATLSLQAQWAKRRSQVSSGDARVVDTRVDHAWSDLAKALDATRGLPKGERAAVADKLYATLFGSGLGFLLLKFPAQWAECKLRIQRIENEGLEVELAQAAGGPEFFEEILEAQAAYGAALGTEAPKPAQENVDLAQALGNLRLALESYVGELITWSRRSADHVAPARDALAPIDARRVAATAARGGDQQEPPPDTTPETPVPEVP